MVCGEKSVSGTESFDERYEYVYSSAAANLACSMVERSKVMFQRLFGQFIH